MRDLNFDCPVRTNQIHEVPVNQSAAERAQRLAALDHLLLTKQITILEYQLGLAELDAWRKVFED